MRYRRGITSYSSPPCTEAEFSGDHGFHLIVDSLERIGCDNYLLVVIGSDRRGSGLEVGLELIWTHK